MVTLPIPSYSNLSIRCDTVVIGYDGENADMDRPNGEIYGFDAYLVIRDEHGRQWAHDHSFREQFEWKVMDAAKMLRERIFASGKALNPEHWKRTYPVYGSPAQYEYEHGMTPEQRAM